MPPGLCRAARAGIRRRRCTSNPPPCHPLQCVEAGLQLIALDQPPDDAQHPGELGYIVGPALTIPTLAIQLDQLAPDPINRIKPQARAAGLRRQAAAIYDF